jgi:hypothetical protein
MCPVDTEFSTFSIRRTLYFTRREEGSRNPPARNARTAEERQPSTPRSPDLSRAEPIPAHHQDMP